MAAKAAEFTWGPLSDRQLRVLTWWRQGSAFRDYNGVIADGAIRSGKTVSMGFSFVEWAMESFSDQNFALCGKTIASLRRNVISTLKRQLKARGYKVREKRSDNLLVITRAEVKNEFYLFGGKDEGSQDLIQGITLAGVFFDEVALMPESFVNQATARCSVAGSKFWFNCNPEDPEHWFYKNWILKCRVHKLVYLHFEMDDNLTLSEEIKARYRTRYTGVFFLRFIKGLWVTAEGIIFPTFAENPDARNFSGDLPIFSRITIGIDFGGNGSATRMTACGYVGGYKRLIVLDEAGLPANTTIDANAICKLYVEFYQRVTKQFGRVDFVFGDSASPTMINTLVSAAKSAGLPWRHITGCRKNSVEDRPRTISALLGANRLAFLPGCKATKRALASLRWDEKKKDQPEDKNIGNINDIYDSFCYCWLDFVEYIDRKRVIY